MLTGGGRPVSDRCNTEVARWSTRSLSPPPHVVHVPLRLSDGFAHVKRLQAGQLALALLHLRKHAPRGTAVQGCRKRSGRERDLLLRDRPPPNRRSHTLPPGRPGTLSAMARKYLARYAPLLVVQCLPRTAASAACTAASTSSSVAAGMLPITSSVAGHTTCSGQGERALSTAAEWRWRQCAARKGAVRRRQHGAPQ